MRPFVAAQVDPLARDPDARHERLDETLLRADDSEDAAIVVGVGVNVEQACVLGQCLADRVDRRPLAPFAEVRDRLER